jgi:glycosyltransferase involved in cell wall biosynthesis
LTTDEFERIFPSARGKITTVYFGPGGHFRRVRDAEILAAVKKKYRLPDRFILTLSGYDRGKRKNIDRLLEAYRLFHGTTPHALVVGGRDCDRFRVFYRIPPDGYGADIHFPGWIDQEDLPAIYSMADLYLYPSNLEAFPIPLTEAMACGTPIITSSLNGLKEIAGNAALFVDADNPREIAQAITRVLSDDALRSTLSASALERSQVFSWKKCARETLALIESLRDPVRIRA